MKLKLLFPFFLFVSLALIPIVKAEGEINLLDLPSYFAEQLGVSTFVGGLMAATILLLMGLMPVFILTRNQTAHLIVGMLMLSIGIGLGWLPVWSLIAICFLIAVMFSSKFKGVLS